MTIAKDGEVLTRGSRPIGAAGIKNVLVAADTACAAAGAWTYTPIVNLDDGQWRRIRLMLDLDSQAVGNVVALLPLVSFSEVAPASGADDWFMIGTTDGTTTTTAMTGTVATGADYTLPPSQVTRIQRGLVLLSPPTLNLTDELRLAFEALDITGARHMQIAYAESVTGITATPSKIGLWYALGI